jgi:hypothetical protein
MKRTWMSLCKATRLWKSSLCNAHFSKCFALYRLMNVSRQLENKGALITDAWIVSGAKCIKSARVLHLPRALKVATLHTYVKLKNSCLCVWEASKIDFDEENENAWKEILMSKGKKGTKWKFIDPSGAMFTFMKLAQY